MTKNYMPELSDFTRIERVLLVTGELRASDRARLAYRSELEVDRENGIHIVTRQDDEGTPEREAKGDLYTEESDTISHKRSKAEAPLDRYKRRHELDPRAGDANYRLWKGGHELRKLFRMARFSPRVIANLLAAGGSGAGIQAEIADNAADARHAYQRAMVEMGPVLAPVLVHVVCMEETAQSWAAAHAPSCKDGLPALRLALERLARHFETYPPFDRERIGGMAK